MKHLSKSHFWLLAFIMLINCQSNAQLPQGVKKFPLRKLLDKTNDPILYNRFLDESTISAGIYQLKVDAKDDQAPHAFDEIYYILDGEAKLKAGDTSAHVSQGSIVYVRAHVPHYFFDITKNLNVLVLFSKGKEQSTDPASRFYTHDKIKTAFSADEITWSDFHKCHSMTLGIYSLPKVTGGDSTLTHKMDEINVMLKGNATFSIDGNDTLVESGDIVFVPKGLGHYFHHLKNDFEVMILFENKSIQE